MKKLLLILIITATALSLASCNMEFGEGPRPSDESTLPDVPSEPNPNAPTSPVYSWNDYDTISIAKALEICNTLASGAISEETYYIKAKIDSITNALYGAMIISDDTGEISVYNTKSSSGIDFALLSAIPFKGDEVLLSCTLQNYNGTPEIKQAYLIDFKKNEVTFNPSDYPDMTVSEARNAEAGTKMKISGTVARITYANGKIPSGYILVDNASSIYVYDSESAQRVKIGNKVSVIGEKDYWILDDEQYFAEKYGYKGCCQLSSATLVELDTATGAVDLSWAAESTMKDILETPFSENSTTLIYKVTARVSKSVGTGFVNYYFNDLDYVDSENPGTGTYAYTQCNGADFAWLDEFDGKLCTVYITALNAKSSNAGCKYRVLPIAIEAIENFEFEDAKVPEHVVKYYAKDQFLPFYYGNPNMKLISSVSSAALGFEGAEIEYLSSDTAVADFVSEGGETFFRCYGTGSVTVTVKATYEGYEYSTNVEISIQGNRDVEYVTVADAISADSDSTVAVKGIVGPSLVNQTGFYLIDETGAIAVRVSADTLKTLEIGYEVVLEGKRTVTKDGGGQICLDSAVVAANYYGEHEYSTASFITGKTLSDLIALADTPEQTAKVYVIEASIKKVDSQYYSNIYVVSGTSELLLYSTSAKQYAFLYDYIGETLTIEINTCDWNARGLKGCVLAIYTDDGKILNMYNF